MTFRHRNLQVILSIVFFNCLACRNFIYIGRSIVDHAAGNYSILNFSSVNEFAQCSENIVNYSSIILVDDVVNISVRWNFSMVRNISIAGNNTVVNCHGDNFGLYFSSVSNISISRVSFSHCSLIEQGYCSETSKSVHFPFETALYFQYCMDITLDSVTFTENRGFGVAMFDCSGVNTIKSCKFEGNHIAGMQFSGGNGLHLEITPNFSLSKDAVNNSVYIIHDCKFFHNDASVISTTLNRLERCANYKLGRGGGLYMELSQGATKMNLTISSCSFVNNSAEYGGALYIKTRNVSRSNVSITDCNFTANRARVAGGGMHLRRSNNHNVKFLLTRCVFKRNCAQYSGGMAIIGSRMRNDTVIVEDCHWINNSAHYAAAIEVSTEWGTSYKQHDIVFSSCSFLENFIVPLRLFYPQSVLHTVYKGNNIFSIVHEHVDFEKSVCFRSNNGTALSLYSSSIGFKRSTVAHFMNNAGVKGGGIYLDDSLITVEDDTQLYFKNNVATYGGAISVESHDKRNPRMLGRFSCPLRYTGSSTTPRNVTFHFKDNNASGRGDSIYFTTVDVCVFYCHPNHSAADFTIESVFECIGKIDYDESKTREFVTFNHDFHIRPNEYLNQSYFVLAVPGQKFQLLVDVLDQFNNTVIPDVYSAKVDPPNIYVDPNFKCAENSLKVYGKPLTNGILTLENRGYFDFSIQLNISLLHCPPAYEIHYKHLPASNLKVESCVCTTNRSLHPGVFCGNDNDNIGAFLLHGYWAGYIVIDGEYPNSKNFFTFLCPPNFCHYNNAATSVKYTLPNKTSPEDLDKFVCGPYRTGILCGECLINMSVFFHSPDYACYPDELCSLG